MLTMRLFHLLWLFILWLNVDESLQQNDTKCTVPVIENGYVSGDIQEYKEHEVLHFVCNPTYKRTWDRPSNCTKIGHRAEWSPTPACESIKCRLSLLPPKGTRYDPPFRNVFSPGETVEITCGDRYWISLLQDTSAVATCKDDGEWTFTPMCNEITCELKHPHVYYWDAYSGQNITLDETVNYWCKPGYKSTDGATWATCTRDGWRPNPLCQEMTCTRHDIQIADIVNFKQKYSYHEQAIYVCKDGYEGRFYLTCEEDGWNGNPQCKEIKCNVQYYQNTDIDGNSQLEYKYNDQVEYVCKDGYEGRFSLTCGKKGWIGSPQCRDKRCKKLNISNAYITRNKKENYTHHERVQYECSNSKKCFTLVCSQACAKPNVPHGFIVGPYNETLYYTCEEGYKLVSKGWWGEATCNDGIWSGLEQCIEKSKCGELPLIPHRKLASERNNYRQGERVPIICEEGYIAQIDHITCRKGKWQLNGTPLKTICASIASHCSAPPKVENAVVVTSPQREYLSGSEVTYHCRENYILEGDATITCNNGKWEERNITCAAPTLER
ncbi:complement factor H-like isoform X2 [Trachinotus anak]|uniref:complement factor H-like isoform X2 n=1 Tax=Trachinotus anak TaxID=443729 RepID=UPI0039F1B880